MSYYQGGLIITNYHIDNNSFLGLLIYIQTETGWLDTMIRKIQTLFSKTKTAKFSEDEAAVKSDGSASVEMRIKAIMAGVFKIDINEISEETSADNVDHWNSLEHVDLLVNLQKEFDIEFTDSQIVEMLSYKTVFQNVTAAIKGINN